jgi:SAM-dependent methyltransferase
MADRGRSVVFGRDAAKYEDARPSYPGSAIEELMGLVEAREVVEIGAGTGIATALVAREGIRVVCVEPSTQMAGILREKRLPGVEVVADRFEDWEFEPGMADLVFAAQSWHWVDTGTGFAKVFSLLRPGGALALMWNIPRDRYGRHEKVYRRLAPHLLRESDERIHRRDHHDWEVDMAGAGLVDTRRSSHSWSQVLTAAQYRGLYATYSDHMMLPEPNRTELLDALAADVEGWGGTVVIEYDTVVFSGIKPVPDPG